MRKRESLLLITIILTWATAVDVSFGQDRPVSIPKRPRVLSDYKPRTLRELGPDMNVGPTAVDGAETSVVYGNILPSRVRVVYTGSSRTIPGNKSQAIQEWAAKYAGNTDHYTANRETEMLFTEEGVQNWLSVPNKMVPQFEKKLKQGDLVYLYVIRLASVRQDNKWEPVLLVEEFERPY